MSDAEDSVVLVSSLRIIALLGRLARAADVAIMLPVSLEADLFFTREEADLAPALPEIQPFP